MSSTPSTAAAYHDTCIKYAKLSKLIRAIATASAEQRRSAELMSGTSKESAKASRPHSEYDYSLEVINLLTSHFNSYEGDLKILEQVMVLLSSNDTKSQPRIDFSLVHYDPRNIQELDKKIGDIKEYTVSLKKSIEDVAAANAAVKTAEAATAHAKKVTEDAAKDTTAGKQEAAKKAAEETEKAVVATKKATEATAKAKEDYEKASASLTEKMQGCRNLTKYLCAFELKTGNQSWAKVEQQLVYYTAMIVDHNGFFDQTAHDESVFAIGIREDDCRFYIYNPFKAPPAQTSFVQTDEQKDREIELAEGELRRRLMPQTQTKCPLRQLTLFTGANQINEFKIYNIDAWKKVREIIKQHTSRTLPSGTRERITRPPPPSTLPSRNPSRRATVPPTPSNEMNSEDTSATLAAATTILEASPPDARASRLAARSATATLGKTDATRGDTAPTTRGLPTMQEVSNEAGPSQKDGSSRTRSGGSTTKKGTNK